MIEDMVRAPTLTIRIPTDLLAWVHATAGEETRSVNGQIVQLLKEAKIAREAGRAG